MWYEEPMKSIVAIKNAKKIGLKYAMIDLKYLNVVLYISRGNKVWIYIFLN